MLFQTSDGHGDLIGQATLLESAKLPQAQQSSHAVPSCRVLFFEPSTLQTTNSQGRSGAHGAPVENVEEESNIEANKRQILFSLNVCRSRCYPALGQAFSM